MQEHCQIFFITMSMYNMLFGRNKHADRLLEILELDTIRHGQLIVERTYRVGRFRDIWLNEDGTEISLYTRDGGQNRECEKSFYPYNQADEDDSDTECGCTGCIMTHEVPSHPCYLYDEDDPNDNTYAKVVYSVPVEFEKECRELAAAENKVAKENQLPEKEYNEKLLSDITALEKKIYGMSVNRTVSSSSSSSSLCVSSVSASSSAVRPHFSSFCFDSFKSPSDCSPCLLQPADDIQSRLKEVEGSNSETSHKSENSDKSEKLENLCAKDVLVSSSSLCTAYVSSSSSTPSSSSSSASFCCSHFEMKGAACTCSLSHVD